MVEWYEAYADYEDAARAPRGGRRRARPATAVGEPRDRLRARRGGASRSPTRSASAPGSTSARARDRDALAAAIATAGSTSRPTGAAGRQLVDELLSKLRRADADRSRRSSSTTRSSSRRSPRRTAREPGLVERWEAYAGGIEIANAFTRAQRPRRAARAVRRAAARAAAAATRRRSRSTRRSSRRSSRACRRPAGVGLGIDRLVMLLTGPALDPRGRPVPGAARP